MNEDIQARITACECSEWYHPKDKYVTANLQMEWNAILLLITNIELNIGNIFGTIDQRAQRIVHFENKDKNLLILRIMLKSFNASNMFKQ